MYFVVPWSNPVLCSGSQQSNLLSCCHFCLSLPDLDNSFISPFFGQPGCSVSWVSALLASSFTQGCSSCGKPLLGKPFLHHPSQIWLLWLMELHAWASDCSHLPGLLSTCQLYQQKMMADQFCFKFCKQHEALLCFFSSKKAEQF